MTKYRLVILGFLFMSFQLMGDFNRTTGLIDIPSAPSLKHGELTGVFNSSFNLKRSVSHPSELDLSVKFGLGNRFEGAITGYHFNAYALSGSYLVMEENKYRPAIVFGIDDITYNEYVSSIGVGDKTFSDDSMYIIRGGRNPELLSAYFSFTKHFKIMRMVIGLGRGRFVGYGPMSHYFNTDGLFRADWEHGHSTMAIGLFFGTVIIPYPGLELIAEFDGRDANAGLKYKLKYGAFNLGFTHLEQLRANTSGIYSPRISTGFEVNSRIFTERPKYGIITGIIVDQATQQKISNVLLKIDELNKQYRIRAGRFKLTLKPGGYTFKVNKQGYGDRVQRVVIKPSKTIETAFYLLKSPEAIAEEKKVKEIEMMLRKAVDFYNNDSLFKAKIQFQDVLKIDSKNQNAQNYLDAINRKIVGLIVIYRQSAIEEKARKNYTVAIRNWKNILELDPDNQEAKAEIVVLNNLMTKKQKLKAKPKKELATKEEIETLYQRGVRLFGQKRYKEALKVFNTVLKLAPYHTGAKKYQARTKTRLEILDEE